MNPANPPRDDLPNPYTPSLFVNSIVQDAVSIWKQSPSKQPEPGPFDSILVAPEVNFFHNPLLTSLVIGNFDMQPQRQFSEQKQPANKDASGQIDPMFGFGRRQNQFKFDIFEEFSSDDEPKKKRPKNQWSGINDASHSDIHSSQFQDWLKDFEDKKTEKRLKLKLFKNPEKKTSTGESALVLPLREFVRKVNFKHFTNKQYFCKICSQTFESKGGIGGHMSRVHGVYAKKRGAA